MFAPGTNPAKIKYFGCFDGFATEPNCFSGQNLNLWWVPHTNCLHYSSAMKVLHNHTLPNLLVWTFLMVNWKETRWVPHCGTERQHCLSDVSLCQSHSDKSSCSLWHIIRVLATFTATIRTDDIGTDSNILVSTECQQFLFLHFGHSNCCAKTCSHNWRIGHLDEPKWNWQYSYQLLNIVATILHYGLRVIEW